MADQRANGGRAARGSGGHHQAPPIRTDSERVEVDSVHQHSLTDPSDADRTESVQSPTNRTAVLMGTGYQFQSPLTSPIRHVAPQTPDGENVPNSSVREQSDPTVPNSGPRESSLSRGGPKRRRSTLENGREQTGPRTRRLFDDLGDEAEDEAEDEHAESPTRVSELDTEEQSEPLGSDESVDNSGSEVDDDQDDDHEGPVTPRG